MAGLMFLIFTAQQLRKIYRRHNGVAHRVMFYCFVAGAFLPLIEFLQNIGATSMAEWMATPGSEWHIIGSPELIQSLDVAFTITISRSLWIFSLVNLLLACALLCEYILEQSNLKGNGLHAHSILAVVIAGISILGWIFELAAFWSPFEVLATAGALNLLFVLLMCLWCIWLAFFIFPSFDLAADDQIAMEYI